VRLTAPSPAAQQPPNRGDGYAAEHNGLREPQSLLGVLQKCYTMLSCSEVPLTIGSFLRARLSAAVMQFGARLTNAATAWPRTERKSCLPDISSGWLDIIGMSELPEGELAGVGVDAPPQGPFPPGDVRHHPEAPGHSYLGQAAAEPTSCQHQVPSEDPLFSLMRLR
jgi:hypothetical protein